jgi:hypothetical protein
MDFLSIPKKLFDSIREYTGTTGTVAFVDPDQVKAICPKLYLAGVRHFVTMDKGVPKAIQRLVLDEELMAKSEVGNIYTKAVKEFGESFDFDEYNVKADKVDIMLAVNSGHSQNALISGCEIGGSWKNWLIKKGGDVTIHADSLPLKDVDWDHMWKEHLKKTGLAKEWEAIAAVVDGRTFETSHAIQKRYPVSEDATPEESLDQFDKARQEFNNQPPVMALTELGYNWVDINFAARGKEMYQKHKGLGSFLPLAYLSNDKWEQRAHREFMGLFEEEVYPDDWLEQMTNEMNTLPGDTLLTVVECHC